MARSGLGSVLVVALVAAACAGAEGTSEPPSSGEGALIELTEVDELREQFNNGPGTPRLILLMSPT